MHKIELFPHFLILQRLVDGSLNQSHNLITALRRWVLINWFYGEESNNIECNQGSGLTFKQWSECFFNQYSIQLQQSFQSKHPLGRLLEKNNEIFKSHHRLCPCYKTAKDWLRFYSVNVDDWLENLRENIYISKQTIVKVINDRLFAKVRKTLQGDINFLTAKECLECKTSLYKKQNLIYRVEKLPDWIFTRVSTQPENSAAIFTELNFTELADLAKALNMLNFLDPKLAPIADKISSKAYGTRRVFLSVDYILPEEIQINVDNLQDKLQVNWRNREIKPIFFDYTSARLGDKQCLVYPVCIYYLQRAKYLCAYGMNPNGEVDWYNYRLERINSLFFVDWSDERIPLELLDKYLKNQLPQPEDVQQEITSAWGFEINKPSRLMLLRFNQDYDKRYIQDTFRHDTFKPIKSPEQVAEIIYQYANSPQEEILLNKILDKYPDDAYYTVRYRDNDNNIVMRLLAWGANVEVLLPMELRERIARSIRQTYQFYQSAGGCKPSAVATTGGTPATRCSPSNNPSRLKTTKKLPKTKHDNY
jgi:CRISPR-associated protein (TIGR03985 family)